MKKTLAIAGLSGALLATVAIPASFAAPPPTSPPSAASSTTRAATALVVPGDDEESTAASFGPSTRAAITRIVEQEMAASRLPGVSIRVIVPGRGWYVREFGVRNVKTGAPMRAEDHVRIASITKSYTATEILRLVDRGLIGLDDNLSEYIQGIPNGRRITIRQMLDMTAGIYSFTEYGPFLTQFTRNPEMTMTLERIIRIVRKNKPDFAPGKGWHYSDTNYWLLGAIIEKVTGQSLAEALNTDVIGTLGLEDTVYPSDATMIAPLARGYVEQGRGPLRDITRVNPDVAAGAGAAVSTVDDLQTWVESLANGTLISKRMQRQRLKFIPSGISDPQGRIRLSYGLGITNINGFLGHDGAIFGYSTVAFHLPSTGATIVIAANQSTNFTTPTLTMALNIMRLLYPNRFRPTR